MYTFADVAPKILENEEMNITSGLDVHKDPCRCITTPWLCASPTRQPHHQRVKPFVAGVILSAGRGMGWLHCIAR